jgi:Tol biopolymer transport system component
MNASGKSQHQITFGPDSQTEPCFSPNGKQVAYVNSPRYGIWQIYLISITGKGRRQLTNTSEQDTEPIFDKTGTTVFYDHCSEDEGTGDIGRLQIYAVNIFGGKPLLLGFGTRPTISYHGTQIAFYDEPQNQTLGVMNTNGTSRRTVGTNLGDGLNLVYCADGMLLTSKTSSRPDTDNLVTINPGNGTLQTVATIDPSSHYPDR